VKVDVRHVQLHGPALGDLPGFVQIRLRALGTGAGAGEIAQPGAGEKTADHIVVHASAAEPVHGRVHRSIQFHVFSFQWVASGEKDGFIKRGAPQREVVEGDVEKPVLRRHPLERLRRALGDSAAGLQQFWLVTCHLQLLGYLPCGVLARREEQVAIPEAAQRVEQGVFGRVLGLHLLGLAEERQGPGPAARLVQGVGVGRAIHHPLTSIAAAVGVGHGLLGVPPCPRHLPQRQL
jgi:hypothetical protein